MKKNDFTYLVIFLVVALFAIPMSAFLTSEVIGLKSTQTIWCWVYIFFKDQGSFIGGALAFIGVIFVINSQWKSTTRIIDDAAKRLDMDRFENYKDSADEAIYTIQEMGVGIIPQVGIMVSRGQRFITRETFPEYIFKDFKRESKVVRKFLDRYGEEKTVVIFNLVDSWFKALDNLLRYEGDGEIVEGYVSYLQFCMFEYSMLPKESKSIDFGSAIQGGKKLYFNDIVELSEKLDISDFDGVLLFMEVAYAWIRRHALQQTIVDIDRTLPS